MDVSVGTPPKTNCPSCGAAPKWYGLAAAACNTGDHLRELDGVAPICISNTVSEPTLSDAFVNTAGICQPASPAEKAASA